MRHHLISRRLGAALSILALAPAPLLAQAVPLSYRAPGVADDPAEALGRYLRILSSNPRHLESLIGAGRAALAVGDASAAIGFFARAEELAPRNGRIKAGLAAALVQIEQPRPALRLFGEAVSLGVPEIEIAADRGLAYDLRGNPRRAQADYALVLARGDDPETVRRLALSRAIAGDAAGALATLQPQLGRGDPAAERTRAFVLALTGDQAGAARVAEQAMPGGQGVAMATFLGRLTGLKPSQKAMAVHFGHLPSSGRTTTAAASGLYADATRVAARPSVDRALIPAGPPLGRTPPPAAAPPRTKLAADIGVGRLTPTPVAPPPAPKRPATIAASRLKLDVAALSAAAALEAGQASVLPVVAKAGADKPAKATPVPERYWVQLASGANKAGLGKLWTKYQTDEPALLGARDVWIAPWRASNRLLTGPFKSEREAQAFVNRLSKVDIPAIQFTTRAGVEVEQLAAR